MIMVGSAVKTRATAIPGLNWCADLHEATIVQDAAQTLGAGSRFPSK